MEKLIDMHTHTSYSDGELSPNELINLAITKNIKTLAITDHDTINGVKLVKNNSKIEVISGIELSAKATRGQFHILGYDIDINSPVLNNKMAELKDNSINALMALMVEIKKDYGISFSYEDIKELLNAEHNLGRPDIAKLLIKYGYAYSIQHAFDKYLNPSYNKIRGKNKGLYCDQCIKLILKSGGIPVLAHPKQLKMSSKSDFIILLKTLMSYGLKGIEVYHSSHTEEDIKFYLEVAEANNLLISGGSDFHGKSVKPDIELGTGKNNNIKIKELSLLDEIHNRR